jgi:hypothetical protein
MRKLEKNVKDYLKSKGILYTRALTFYDTIKEPIKLFFDPSIGRASF